MDEGDTHVMDERGNAELLGRSVSGEGLSTSWDGGGNVNELGGMFPETAAYVAYVALACHIVGMSTSWGDVLET